VGLTTDHCNRRREEERGGERRGSGERRSKARREIAVYEQNLLYQKR
jgi:hypothetical protein